VVKCSLLGGGKMFTPGWW